MNQKCIWLKVGLLNFKDYKGELLPWREIALDAGGKPVFAGPDRRNYGFWQDSNMKFEDFDGDIIEKDEFEHYWSMSGTEALELDKE